MLKICYGCESDFPDGIVRYELSKIPENSYLYTYNSKANHKVKCLATEVDFRVIVFDCPDDNKISGIIEILNICNIVILFYNDIQYANGLDLIKKVCIAYKIPLKIIYSNNKTAYKFNNYPRPLRNIRSIDYMKIAYHREENINTNYDRRNALFNLMIHYDNISSKKKDKRIVILEPKFHRQRFALSH